MHVSMLVRRGIALLAVLVVAAACSDAPSAPSAAARSDILAQSLQPSALKGGEPAHGNGKGGGDVTTSETVEATFTVDPRRTAIYSFGQNWIYVPANSICEPQTSTYGLGQWDAPCQPLQQPITITARWSPKGGHGYVEFEPELRFAPSANSRNWVYISMYDRKPLHDMAAYNIVWCDGQGQCVDEAATDPTLRAWVDRPHNAVLRRIKHFSGYMITAAFADFGGFGDVAY
jgi:hypothetical protein